MNKNNYVINYGNVIGQLSLYRMEKGICLTGFTSDQISIYESDIESATPQYKDGSVILGLSSSSTYILERYVCRVVYNGVLTLGPVALSIPHSETVVP